MAHDKRLIIFTDCGDTIIDEATQVFDDRHIVLEAEPIPGALEALRTLRAEGYTIAAVIDGEVESFRNIFRQHSMTELFDAVVISETVGVQKPAEIMFRTAMDALALTDEDKKRVVMIGNNLRKDVAGANRFGLTSIWLSWSPRYFREFEEPDWRPAHEIKDPVELVPLIHELEAGLR